MLSRTRYLQNCDAFAKRLSSRGKNARGKLHARLNTASLSQSFELLVTFVVSCMLRNTDVLLFCFFKGCYWSGSE